MNVQDEPFKQLFDRAADKEFAELRDLFRDRSTPCLAAVLHRLAVELRDRGAPGAVLADALAEAIRQGRVMSPKDLAEAVDVHVRLRESGLPNDEWPGYRETMREDAVARALDRWIAQFATALRARTPTILPS